MAKLKISKNDGVVLINGYSLENNDYETLMPSLKRSKHVLIISLPGDLGQAENDFIKYDEWIKMHSATIEQLKLKTKRLLIVGFSIGAVPALYFASRHKADRTALISPVLNYDTFDNSATAMVRIARSTIISKGKTDPLNSIKTLKYVGTFIKNPKKNWAQLFRVRIGPLMRPSNVLLLPIVTLFEDELDKMDAIGGRLVDKLTKKKYNKDFEFESEDEIFNQTKRGKETIVREGESKKSMFASIFKQVRKSLPPEFSNMSSANVYNMMRLLAYCNKFTNEYNGKMTIFRGFYDEDVTTQSVKNVLAKSLHEDNRIIEYNTDMHYLFASPQYGEVAADLLAFLYSQDE